MIAANRFAALRLSPFLRRAAALAWIALVVALAGAAPAVCAATPATVFVEELTWTELRDAVAAGTTTVIVPIGGTEQNGPHMVLGKHNVRVKVLAEKIARALGNALVAPVVAYVPEGAIDPPTAHMRFPGTVTVASDTFQRVLESAARSFRRAGFRDVVFVGDHGGYQKDLRVAADRVNREWAATPARAHAIDAYYRATEDSYKAALRARGLSDAEIGIHAGVADTSLALAVAPNVVRTERLKTGAELDAAHGVYGDPRRASADLGQLGVDIVVAKTVAAIRKATARR